jgi:hypothetical protein
MGMSGQFYALVALPPLIHWIACWVRPRVTMDAVKEEKLSLPGNQTSAFHPVPLIDSQRNHTNIYLRTFITQFHLTAFSKSHSHGIEFKFYNLILRNTMEIREHY